MSPITQLLAGVAVCDLATSTAWYAGLFGRPPEHRLGDELLWEIGEHACLFIEPNPAQAGAARITLSVTELDALLERLAAAGIGHEPVETYANGVRHGTVPDPDGNAIAIAEPPVTPS